MARPRNADGCRIHGRASRWIVACSNEQRRKDKKDAGKFSEGGCLHRCTDARDIPQESQITGRAAYGPLTARELGTRRIWFGLPHCV